MAPLSMEHTARSGSKSRGSQISLPVPFVIKTYRLIDEIAIENLLSWNGVGSTSLVWRPADFARDLLPKYVKPENFSKLHSPTQLAKDDNTQFVAHGKLLIGGELLLYWKPPVTPVTVKFKLKRSLGAVGFVAAVLVADTPF